MNNALDIYSQILKEHLSICFYGEKNLDPIVINKEKFLIKSIFIAGIIFLKNNLFDSQNNSSIIKNCDQWLKKEFSNENFFSKQIKNSSSKLINITNSFLNELKGVEEVDLPSLYETLLSIETSNENNRITISTSKNYRNKLGSYYTPQYLAKTVTKKTIDEFLTLNLKYKNTGALITKLSSVSFVDFSCGGGVFLIEIIKYFEELLDENNATKKESLQLLEVLILNIKAFDVDCLALELAKLSLLLQTDQTKLYNKLKTNFIHANFLLQSGNTLTEEKKVEYFARGFVYHENLELNINHLEKYDVILGNPPWEKIRFEEKKFYALYHHSIANNHFKASRLKEIEAIEDKRIHLSQFSKEFKNEIDKAKINLKNNSFFNLSHKGELNTYALFTDAAIKLRSKRGVIGLVLKSAIVTSQVNKLIFNYLTKTRKIIDIRDFINRKRIFNIDSRERFCFLLLGQNRKTNFSASMNLTEISDIFSPPTIRLSHDDLFTLNPLNGMLPNFSTREEIEFILRMSSEHSFFNDVYSSVRFGRIVHFTSHAKFISKLKTKENLPIYEGKFFHQFDGKYSGFNAVNNNLRYRNKSSSSLLENNKKENPDYFPESRFFINKEKWVLLSKNHHEKYMLAWRSLTSASNARTCIATILPFIPASQSVQFLTTDKKDLLYLSGLFNSVVFDFILRKKLNGIDLTQSMIKQIPVPSINRLSDNIIFEGEKRPIKEHISSLVFSLLANDSRLYSLGKGLRKVKGNRFNIVRKIDLLYLFLYGLNKQETKLVLSEFKGQYSHEDQIWFFQSLEGMLWIKP